jgi:hypothetical protein
MGTKMQKQLMTVCFGETMHLIIIPIVMARPNKKEHTMQYHSLART